MKKITWILAVTIFVSCQKEADLNPIPKIKPESVAFSPAPAITNIIPNNIVSSTVVSGVETFTYSDHSIAKMSGLGKINITVSKGGKIDTLTATDITFNGIRTVKYYTKGKLYFSFDANSSGMLNNIYVSDIYYPFKNIYPTGGVPFLRCMQNYINKCRSSWTCKLMFGTTLLGITGAGIGWGAGCLLGIKP